MALSHSPGEEEAPDHRWYRFALLLRLVIENVRIFDFCFNILELPNRDIFRSHHGKQKGRVLAASC